MFERPIYYTAQQSTIHKKKYQRHLEELDDAINLEQEKLGQWLISWENKKTLHYKIVEDIYNYFYQEDKDKNNQPLSFRENRLSDLSAVNNAIYKGEVSDLRARSKASMQSKHFGCEIIGVLMGCLAVVLTAIGCSTFHPPLIIMGLMIGMAAYQCHEYGSAKIHAEKSTLFAKLNNHFVSTAAASPKPVHNEAALYARHML